MSRIMDSYGFLFAKAAQRLHELLNPVLEEERITPKQLGLLLIVKENPGITQKEAAFIEQIDRTTMTQLVDTLENAEHIKRVSTPNDRRAYGLFLTPQGTAKVELLWSHINKAQSRLLSKLSRKQAAALKELLQTIIEEER